MSYATVMIYIEAGRTPEQRVRITTGLADKFNATLIGVSAIPIAPPVVANGVVTLAPTEDDIERIRAELAKGGNWFRAIAGDHRKPEWRSFLDFPAAIISREARSADLVIIGQTKWSLSEYGSVEAGDAILQMGRPTLVVPEGVGSLQAKHVVIGWKDAREARRAVCDAIPFLREAERVTVVELCGPNEEKSAVEHVEDVARYLMRHRINSGTRVMLQEEGSAAAQLTRLAQNEGADLLVTGAYGHSRLGEWIFGGMTRDLLATSPICCLMSH